MERLRSLDVSHTVYNVRGHHTPGTGPSTMFGAFTVPSLVPTMHRHPLPMPTHYGSLGATSTLDHSWRDGSQHGR